MAKRKDADGDDVQKVSLEEVGSRVKDEHDRALKGSIFTERVFLSMFGAVFAIATSFQMWMQYKTGQLATTAATKVEQVAVTLEETTKVNQDGMKELKKTADATHKAVNSNFGVQLKISALALRQVADYAKQFDMDRYNRADAAAIVAENLLDEYEKEQKKIDNKEEKE